MLTFSPHVDRFKSMTGNIVRTLYIKPLNSYVRFISGVTIAL